MVKILEITDLNYQLFNRFNLSFNSNTFYSIVGSNKSGKTLLFKILTGLIITNNIVTCSKVTLNNNTKYDYIKKIGVVTTIENNSFLFKKVMDELMYPLYNLNYNKRKAFARINYLLKEFELENILYKNILELNIYEKQKLLIILALLHQPKVLLLDNALSIFDKDDCLKIISILKDIMNDDKITIINFTANLEETLMSDYILLLSYYQIIKIIKPNELVSCDKLFYENNLEIPFIVDLNVKLRMYGLIHNDYYSINDMVNDIWQ